MARYGFVVGMAVAIGFAPVAGWAQGHIFSDGFESGNTSQWTSSTNDDTRLTIDLPWGVTMELLYVQPGTFLMGSPVDERGRTDYEDLHRVGAATTAGGASRWGQS